MVLEVAILDVKPSMEKDFEVAFNKAQLIIIAIKGYISHQLQKCLETPNRYILLITWESLQDHTIGFRESPEYQQWKVMLHHFYEPFPVVEHYQLVTQNQA